MADFVEKVQLNSRITLAQPMVSNTILLFRAVSTAILLLQIQSILGLEKLE